MSVFHSFSIKNIFYDKMNFRLFYFHVTIFVYSIKIRKNTDQKNYELEHFSRSELKLKELYFSDEWIGNSKVRSGNPHVF